MVTAVSRSDRWPPAIVTRTFTSFAQAADEASHSRIYGGIHFEFDSTAGLAAGRALGSYVVASFLTPRSE